MTIFDENNLVMKDTYGLTISKIEAQYHETRSFWIFTFSNGKESIIMSETDHSDIYSSIETSDMDTMKIWRDGDE